MRYRLKVDGYYKTITGYDFISEIPEELKTYQIWKETWYGSWKCIKTFITLDDAKNYLNKICRQPTCNQ